MAELKKTHKLYGQIVSVSEILKYDSSYEFYVKMFLFSCLESPVGEKHSLVIILVGNGESICDTREKFSPSCNYIIDNVEVTSLKVEGAPVLALTSLSSVNEVKSEVHCQHLALLKRKLEKHTYFLTVTEVIDDVLGIYNLESNWTLLTTFHYFTPIISVGDVLAISFPHVLMMKRDKVLICCPQSTLHITNTSRTYSSECSSLSHSMRSALSSFSCCATLVFWAQKVKDKWSKVIHCHRLSRELLEEELVKSLLHEVMTREVPQWDETSPRPLYHFSAPDEHICNYKPPVEITSDVVIFGELLHRHQLHVQSQRERNISRDVVWWSTATNSNGILLGKVTFQHTGVICVTFSDDTESVILHVSRDEPKVLNWVEEGDLVWIFNSAIVTESFNIRTDNKRMQLSNKSYLTVESSNVIPVKKRKFEAEDSYLKISVINKYNIVVENSSSLCKSDLFFVCMCIVTSSKSSNGVNKTKSENCLMRFKGADLMKIYSRVYEGCDIIVKEEKGGSVLNSLKNCSWANHLVNNQTDKIVCYDFLSSEKIHSISESEDVSTLMKYRTTLYESLSQILKPDFKCGVPITIVASIASRYHQESLFKSEKENLSEHRTDLDIGFPGGKLIRLLLEDTMDKSSCCIYIPLKSGTLMTKYPLALLPGCVIRFTRVIKYSSKNSGKIYLKSTSFSTFDVLKYPAEPEPKKETCSANDDFTEDSSNQNEDRPDEGEEVDINYSSLTSITLREACKDFYLGKTFTTFASVLRLHKLLIRLKCSCNTHLQSTHCPNPCCSSTLPPTLDIYAKLTLTSDQHHVTVILKDSGVLLKVLDLSVKMWEKIRSQLISNRIDVKYVPLQNGGLTDFEAIDTLEEREALVKKTILLYLHKVCSFKDYMKYSTWVLKRFWKNDENKRPLFYCVDILDDIEMKSEPI